MRICCYIWVISVDNNLLRFVFYIAQFSNQHVWVYDSMNFIISVDFLYTKGNEYFFMLYLTNFPNVSCMTPLNLYLFILPIAMFSLYNQYKLQYSMQKHSNSTVKINKLCLLNQDFSKTIYNSHFVAYYFSSGKSRNYI